MSRFSRYIRLTVASGALVASFLLFAGCKADECQQMTECCAAVADVPGVGSACGELADQTRDPDTCRTILKTVRYMYEDRSGDAPPVCRPETGERSSLSNTITPVVQGEELTHG